MVYGIGRVKKTWGIITVGPVVDTLMAAGPVSYSTSSTPSPPRKPPWRELSALEGRGDGGTISGHDKGPDVLRCLCLSRLPNRRGLALQPQCLIASTNSPTLHYAELPIQAMTARSRP